MALASPIWSSTATAAARPRSFSLIRSTEIQVPPDTAALDKLIRHAIRTGLPEDISRAFAAAYAEDWDAQERAGIRQFDGGMTKAEAELAGLLDLMDAAG